MEIKLNDFLYEYKYKISAKEICHSPIYIEIICYFFYFLEEKIGKSLSKRRKSTKRRKLTKKRKSIILDKAIEKYFYDEVRFKLKNIFEEVLNMKLLEFLPNYKSSFCKLTSEEYANLFIKDKENKYKYFEKIITEENLSSKKIRKDSLILLEIRNYLENSEFKKKNLKLLKELTIKDLTSAVAKDPKKIEEIYKMLENNKDIFNNIINQLEELKISLELFLKKFLFYMKEDKNKSFEFSNEYKFSLKEEVLEILKTDIYIENTFRIPIKGDCSIENKKYTYEILVDKYEVVLKEKDDVLKKEKIISRIKMLENIFYDYNSIILSENKGKIFIRSDIFEELKNEEYYLNNNSYDENTRVFLLINDSKKKNKKHKLLILEDDRKITLNEDFYNLGSIFVLKNGGKNYSTILNSYGMIVEVENSSPKGIKVIPCKLNIEGLTIIKAVIKTPISNKENKFYSDNRYILFYKNLVIPMPCFKNTRNQKSKKQVNVEEIIIEKIDLNFIKAKIIVEIQEFKAKDSKNEDSKDKDSKLKKIRKEKKCMDEIYYFDDYRNKGKKITLKMSKFEERKFYQYENLKNN